MTAFRLTSLLGAAAALALLPSAGLAQRQPPSPEQRLQRLEKQVEQVQRRVFPKGRPADTAGFSDDPAASQVAVVTLSQRLDALESQMRGLLRQLEENNNVMRTVQQDAVQVARDNKSRIDALERRIAEGMIAAPPAATTVDPRPATTSNLRPAAAQNFEIGDESGPTSDPGEDAYSEGFRLWRDGKYDQAINSLRAFVKAYPSHRRVSYANNLIGRSLLDKGEPRAAAQAFLANYRGNTNGERAQDSLFYLGQSLMKLGQASQACKSYAELGAVYGSRLRADLAKQVDAAKLDAKC